jgi:signal peptidase I
MIYLKRFFEIYRIFILALIVSSIFRSVAFNTFIVPTASMTPALQIEDRVLVQRTMISDIDFSRGDIVIFYRPDSDYKLTFKNEVIKALKVWQYTKINKDTELVKRIIGLPGDKILITTSGYVFCNDKQVIKGNSIYKIHKEDIEVEIPQGFVYVLGDNLLNSIDSRVFGFVPIERISGKVLKKSNSMFSYEDI